MEKSKHTLGAKISRVWRAAECVLAFLYLRDGETNQSSDPSSEQCPNEITLSGKGGAESLGKLLEYSKATLDTEEKVASSSEYSLDFENKKETLPSPTPDPGWS